MSLLKVKLYAEGTIQVINVLLISHFCWQWKRHLFAELKYLLKPCDCSQCPSIQFHHVKWHSSSRIDIVLKGSAWAFSRSQYTIRHDFTPRTNDFHQTLITDVTVQATSRAGSVRRNLCSSCVCVFLCFISTGRWTEFLTVCRRISAAFHPPALSLFSDCFRLSFSTLLLCVWLLRSDEVWWSTGPCDSMTSACMLSPILVCDHTHAPCSSPLLYPCAWKMHPAFVAEWVKKTSMI